MSEEQRDERIGWFTEGYAALRPAPEGLRDAMPRLMMLIQAIKVARLLRSYATTTDDASPSWVAEMRATHQRWLAKKRLALTWE